MEKAGHGLEKPVIAYVFIEHLDAEDPRVALKNFYRDNPTVEFVARFVGSFIAFARVKVDTFQELHELMAGKYWNAGVKCSWSTVVALSPGVQMPKKAGTKYCALLRIVTAQGEDPVEVMARLALTFNHWGDHVGIAAVTGDYDILMTIGAQEADRLLDAVLQKVRKVEGVASTETAFADLENNALERNDRKK